MSSAVRRTLGAVAVALMVASGCSGGGGGTDSGGDPGTLDVAPVDVIGHDAIPDPGVVDLPVHDEAVPRDVPLDDGLAPADDGGTAPDEGADADVPVAVDPGLADAPDASDPGADACDAPECLPCPDDGLPCTSAHRDEQGQCVHELLPGFCLVAGECWFRLQPDPSRPCWFCDPDVAADVFSPHEGIPCDDGDPCTASDACGADGDCLAGSPTVCDDQNPCTIDQCLPGQGCIHSPKDAVCDDGSACTYQDQCKAGKCVGVPLPCKDSNPCTDDTCDPAIGCVFPENEAPCNDFHACTTGDVCRQGKCAGTALVCDDGNSCTSDACIDAAGGCVHNKLTGSCNDGNACTINDFCDVDALCKGYDRTCDDKNPCTDDACDPATGCVFTADDTNVCDKKGPCTIAGRCEGGGCVGVARDCRDADPCTVDLCDETSGCEHLETNGPCDDGNPCTNQDSCATGKCVGKPFSCDDSNPCTLDSCDPASGCVHQPINGTCTDGDPCTTGDACVAGACVGTPKDCGDANACTLDGCGPDGQCRHDFSTDPCDDSDACTAADACLLGACMGSVVKCDDGNPCTNDSCMPASGCVHEAAPNPCSDGNACTDHDRCEAGACVGDSITCVDGNECTEDTCDPSTGCVFPALDVACDDANPCTLHDACASSACVSGPSAFSVPTLRAAKLSFGVSGNPGQGVDVDGDPKTCAPVGSCVTGIDNAFGTLAWLLNPDFTKAVSVGDLALVLMHRGLDLTGSPYPLHVAWAKRADFACNPNFQTCTFLIARSDDPLACGQSVLFDNAVVSGTTLRAGGRDYGMTAYLAFGSLRVPVNLAWVRLEATVSLSAEGGIASATGAIGGRVPLQEVMDAVAAQPAAAFMAPFTRDIVLQYMTVGLKPDIDADGDGTKESLSVGFPFTLAPAQVVGLY